MTHQPNQPDPTDLDIARTLAALNSAAPPEGMEARIAQRLAAHSPAPVPFHNLRALIPGPSWLRGAFTGALVATAACALIFYTTRPHHPAQPQVAANTSHPITGTPVTLKTGDICMGAPSIRDGHGADGWDEHSPLAISTHSPGRVPHPSSAWVGNVPTNARVPHSSRPYRDEWEEHSSFAVSSRTPHLIPASFAPSKPAPPAPLTAQERALAELAANPAALAALSPSTDKSDAQREADFQKFFAPPPELIAAEKAQDEALGLTKQTNAQPAKDQN